MRSTAFDYVIVGGGTAGCVLANRLSDDPACSVLLIESGARDWNPLLSIPLGVGMLWQRRLYDWGYDSEPQAALDNRRIEMMRGHVLGGSSSINAMAHVRGAPGDYDRWAANGAPGWAYRDVVDTFRRSERWLGAPHPQRGREGPITVAETGSREPLFDAWLAAASGAGYEVLDDYNTGVREGFGRAQFAHVNGRRANAARAYLRPVLKRPNLTVVTGALATRVMFSGSRAVGVAYTRVGGEQVARAACGIIMAAGVFHTPKLLMQSGIGPAAQLRQHGIKTIADRGQVGENLQDHPGIAVAFKRRGSGEFRDLMRADRVAVAMARAFVSGSGPATVLPSGLHGFVKLSNASPVPEIQFMFRGAPRDAVPWFPGIRAPYRDGFSIRPVVLHPRSRGRVWLTGPEPQDALKIDPALLSDARDMAALRQAVRLGREIGMRPEMDAFRDVESAPGPDITSDRQIDAYIRKGCATAHHPAGTCRMGDDDEAVVDTRLKVNGVDGLWVADASVMPDLVSGNINAAVAMIAERCAAFLTDSRG